MLDSIRGTAPVFEIAGSNTCLILDPDLVAFLTFFSESNKNGK